jgi:hypothetical protein
MLRRVFEAEMRGGSGERCRDKTAALPLNFRLAGKDAGATNKKEGRREPALSVKKY